jgi:hypothetical protein
VSYDNHDHGYQYASADHDHYSDYAEKHHRHYDDESTVSGLREDLGHAEERIRELENDLRGAFERIRALEDGPVPGGGDPDRPETWAFGEPPVIAYPDHEAPEERGVSEYNREEFALDRGEEPRS